jgi:hypothetical protein
MRRLTSPGWLLRHAVAVVLVVTFLILGWWQIRRAAGGNGLSFGYAIEWPFFAGFVAFMWWREVQVTLRGGREATGQDGSPTGPRDVEPAVPAVSGVTAFDASAALADLARRRQAAPTDEAPSDYDRYLAWLAEHPGARPRDYRAAMAGPASEHRQGPAGEESTHG